MGGDLSLNQLRAFYYAANCGSITVAAEKLFITQPAVSMQIKALETQYGVQLFVRGRKKLELTDAGRGLYEVAKKIFGLVGEAEQLLAHAEGASGHVLKIGSTKTLVRYTLARHISAFQQSFPKVQIQIDEGSSQEMVESVLANRIDLAIVGRVPYDRRLEVIPFAKDELVLLVALGHRLCRKGIVSVEELEGENIILREKGSGTRRLVEKILSPTTLVASAFIETANVDFIKELVRIGNGITMLARMGVDQDLNDGGLRIIPLKEGPFYIDCDIVTNRQRPLSCVDEAFLMVLGAKRKSGL
jgi:DNA-binding transcriptional LysR family regulator